MLRGIVGGVLVVVGGYYGLIVLEERCRLCFGGWRGEDGPRRVVRSSGQGVE